MGKSSHEYISSYPYCLLSEFVYPYYNANEFACLYRHNGYNLAF